MAINAMAVPYEEWPDLRTGALLAEAESAGYSRIAISTRTADVPHSMLMAGHEFVAAAPPVFWTFGRQEPKLWWMLDRFEPEHHRRDGHCVATYYGAFVPGNYALRGGVWERQNDLDAEWQKVPLSWFGLDVS